MASSKRLKPFTFFGRVPQGTTTVELTKILVKRFSKSELGGVQDFTAGKYEVFLKTRAAVERFLQDPTIEVKGVPVTFEYRGTRAMLVRVFGYSSEHHDIELTAALQPYGKILSVARESVPGFPTVTTGIRRVRIEMKSAVPNFMEVIDTTVQCEYEGVVRVCRRCGQHGHMGANCETAQCSLCGAYGHEVCEAPCPKCGEDHAVRFCKRKTFASVVGGGDEEEAAQADVWEQPALTQPLAAEASTSASEEAAQGSSETGATSEASAAAAPSEAEEERQQEEVTTDGQQRAPAPEESAAQADEREGSAPPQESSATPQEAVAASDSDMDAENASNKRKRTHTKNNKKKKDPRPKTSASSKSSDEQPLTKRAFLKTPAVLPSSSVSDTETELTPQHDCCQYCGSTTCDCSIVSDNAYESTSPMPSPVSEDTAPSSP